VVFYALPDKSLFYREIAGVFIWWSISEGWVMDRVLNSPTGQVLEAGPGWPVLVMAMTGPD